MAQLGNFLLVSVLLLQLSLSLSCVTIGLEETRKTVTEGDGRVSLCARVMVSCPQYAANVRTAYQDRSGNGKKAVSGINSHCENFFCICRKFGL